VAHDFNNLLTVINGTLDLVLREIPAENSFRSDLQEVRGAGERAALLTRQLLAFSKRQVLRKEAVDLNALILDMSGMLRRLIGEDVVIHTDLDEQRPFALADRSQLEQIIVNLVVNARDAMPTGGTLRITTAGPRPSASPSPEVEPGGHGFVRLSVSDTGEGMETDVQAQIFDPFFTTKEPGRGTGLGMFFAHDVVTAAGGTIEVSSAPGEGTAVTIRLPVIADRRRTYARAQTPIEDIAETFILVIDDEPLVGEAIKRVLSNYQVTVALEGADGIARFREHRHDLVLCDLMMPGMSGQAVYEKLREIDPTVDDRIVFVTGGAFTPAARKFADQMAGRIVKKPVEVADLLRLISEHAG
jgi:CheY-like chemotaxis protein